LLEAKGMARSVFYYHQKRLKEGADKYGHERAEIKTIFQEHKGRYGYRRITDELHNRGYAINHKTVQGLMKSIGLKCQIRKVRYRSYRGLTGRVAPNVLNRDFSADRPDRKWATDVTQISIREKKCYLSPVLDMFNGEIVAYQISDRPDLRMVTDMLRKALRGRKDTNGLIIHSDQGWHYQNYKYRKILADHNITQSMSRKGNCLDNSMMENFFGLMKSELLYANDYQDMEKFKKDLIEYIDYYNNKRIKLRLKGKSPAQYRALLG
jgi:transposase InsO family protein